MKNKRNKNQNSKIQTLKSISKFQTLNSKFHSGITLIALVVTIVILLILAGVTITLMFGENNIFDLAKDAADKTNQAIKDDKTQIDELNKWLTENGWSSSNGGSGETPDVPPTPEIPKGPNGKPLVGSITKNDTENQKVEDKNGNPITIPAGFTVLPNGEDGVEYNHDTENHTPCVEDGIVVQDSSANQFVWVPVDDTAYSKMIDETNHRGNLYDFGSYNSSTKTYTPYTSPQVKTYSATGNREPGTVTSYTSGTTTYNGDEIESNYSDANIKNKEGNLITGKDEFQTLLQTEFNEMAASVKEHKGFYIGRYETGNLKAVKNTTPVVQRGNTLIGGVNWYYMYANSKKIAKDDKYTSSMIWGCQWDVTLDWLVATNGGDYSLITDSSSWGNYKDQTFNYTENGETKEKAENTNTKIPTGSTERNKKNNIYDMAGNVYDWTLEANLTRYRVLRGGYYSLAGSSSPASYRTSDLPAGNPTFYGSRATLYVALNTVNIN